MFRTRLKFRLIVFIFGVLVGSLLTFLYQNLFLSFLCNRVKVRTDAITNDSENGRSKLLCWILTSPEYISKRAVHVRDTWGQRCDGLLFMSSKEDSSLPAVKLNVSEGWQKIWMKTKGAFKHLYDHYVDDYDWFLKADDDTFVIIENLRHFLSTHNSLTPVYFGRRFKPDVRQGYMSGGAGYVLSREALRRFGQGMDDAALCLKSGEANEDIELGKCMENLGVIAGDSRDEFGRETFFPFKPEFHVVSRQAFSSHKDFWFWNNWTYYPLIEGVEGMSDNAVSFHYIKPNQMYFLEYIVHKVNIYSAFSQ